MSKHLPTSPALSLSLAGIFRDGGATMEAHKAAASNMEVEGRDEGSRREGTVEISSSENSGLLRSSRSYDDNEAHGQVLEHHDVNDDDHEEDDDINNKKKKRKKYHRHTPQQIKEMETLFKESPHPDEKQRQQLSKQLGLSPRQVKFWFQNRRTQIKAVQERHENTLLKSEIEKLREEKKEFRVTIKNGSCPNCGFASSSKDHLNIVTKEEEQLRTENARLKAEIERLRASIGKLSYGTSPNSTSSCSGSGGYDQEYKSSLEFYSGIFGLEKSRVIEIGNQAVEEVKKMATINEPLWIKSLETGREILNYDEYMKEFPDNENSSSVQRRCIEASRESGVVFLDIHRLIQSFMDVKQWKEMFPCIIAKATTIDTICSAAEGANSDGAIQLMFAELQMLTPTVASREVYFVRYCKQLNPEEWAIVDVSIDKQQDDDLFISRYKKRPSGCIIQDKSDGHCKVIWVEHMECHRSSVHSMYHAIVNSGLAFGAKHWMATLQQQCERLVFFMATNIPNKDSSGVSTFAGRKSTLNLAQRMTWSFCRALGASSYNSWTKTGDDIRVASRKNLNDPGEPLGVILCAVSSVWLPVSRHSLFDFLRDETRRDEWNVMLNGGPSQSIARLAKGQGRGNAVTLQTMQSKSNTMWILEDSCTNGYESMVVYSPVEMNEMQSVMTGCDSTNLAVLPSGFSILPDGLTQRPSVIMDKSTQDGSLLTIAFQVLASNSPTSKLTLDSIHSVNTLISCTLQKIKSSMHCDDA